ncbi:DUF99 family protein [Planktothrix sp. FACHB-1365]|uniref:endonuclease dU n=1 Tax=Planktothrix sp. FACHB-1365 TaxID=2692855 RepID=UPI0016822E3C|nr:DUF99 family protein [Planktothrix sp. FACHB-1365]MBD2484734.1 DUF99 family protein [Planktothrix sp. FACHB-1365]
MQLESLLRLNRVIRVIGFDDAPFQRGIDQTVYIAGVVCGGTRFEGMVWGQVKQDGWDATDQICQLLINKKFLPQLHLVLIDGIGFGGFNLIDLPELADRLQKPCVTVMRHYPNFNKIEQAIYHLSEPEKRLQYLKKAGTIYTYPPFFFQVCGENPDIIRLALSRITDCGNVPEALRLAHLIGAAIIRGQSGSQA